MLKKLLYTLLILCFGSSVLAEGSVFEGIASNEALTWTPIRAFLVADDDEDDLFVDETPAVQTSRACDLTITMGGDAVVGIREIWWKRTDALPAYLARYGMTYPFSGLQEIFTNDDLTYLNLECTIKETQEGEVTNKEYRFRGLPAYTQVLTEGSVELLNIANNHYVDYKEEGKAETRLHLDQAGLAYAGYGYAYVWQQNGWRIGFAGCRETEFKLDPDIIAREISSLRQWGCDVIIYACHWGKEYMPTHNEDQELMAQLASEAGADIVVGTHPHVVQGLADVNGTAVLWSLGNLMFGGTINMHTFDSALASVQLHFDDHSYTGCTITYIPILTSSSSARGINDYHPILAEGADYSRIMKIIQNDSSMDISQPVYFPARE